jgi:excisionase family DNA binding protein
MNEAKILLNKVEVSKLLRVSPATLDRITKKGELAFVKVGRSVRFKPKDVADYINRSSEVAELVNNQTIEHG